MTGGGRREESAAADGARWITVAFVAVGGLNYGYALLLTHLLNVTSYTKFAAGQSLVLWASTIATVSVPWVLAQAMARARSGADRNAAARFAMMASAGSGIAAGTVVGIVGTQFASVTTALALSVSTLVIFLGTTATGWLQGQQRMRALAGLYVGENVLKNAAGLVLVVIAKLRDTGALAAFGIGGIVMLLWWPRTPRGSGRLWLAAVANADLWRRALGIAGLQAIVSLFAVTDTVLVTLLPGDRALVASYQASSALSRVPLFVASAVATAFFPALSRGSAGGPLAARALRMYAAVAFPLSAALATMPGAVLAAMFPVQYGAMAQLLKYTAVAYLAAGGISIVTAFFQAEGDYSCLPWLGAGLLGYTAALLTGWRIYGIVGLAVGAAIGSVAALTTLGYRLVRRQGPGVFARVSLIEPVTATAVLILVRQHPLLWLTAAVIVGSWAGVRFVRPGARHAGGPQWATRRRHRRAPINAEPSAALLLTEAVWRGSVPGASDTALLSALSLARRNRVEGRLARAYPDRLEAVLADVQVASALFRRNLGHAANGLEEAGIPAVLIKLGSVSDHVCTSIHLVVSEPNWQNAVVLLDDPYGDLSVYRLDRSRTAVLTPPAGPTLHVHTGLSWFGVPTLSTDDLLSRSRRNAQGFLVPLAPDYLRISVAYASSRQFALDLSALLTVSKLNHPPLITAARVAAGREGWRARFDSGLEAAGTAMASLDRGLLLDLPIPLPRAQGPFAANDASDGKPSADSIITPRVSLVAVERKAL